MEEEIEVGGGIIDLHVGDGVGMKFKIKIGDMTIMLASTNQRRHVETVNGAIKHQLKRDTWKYSMRRRYV